MAIVRLPRDLPKNSLFLYLLPFRRREPHFRLGSPPPIIWLHFLLPLPMSGDPRSLRCKHLCDPHSFLTVTFWLLDNFSLTGGEYHSHLLVSVSHHVTPIYTLWPILSTFFTSDYSGSLEIFHSIIKKPKLHFLNLKCSRFVCVLFCKISLFLANDYSN